MRSVRPHDRGVRTVDEYIACGDVCYAGSAQDKTHDENNSIWGVPPDDHDPLEEETDGYEAVCDVVGGGRCMHCGHGLGACACMFGRHHCTVTRARRTNRHALMIHRVEVKNELFTANGVERGKVEQSGNDMQCVCHAQAVESIEEPSLQSRMQTAPVETIQDPNGH